MLGSYQGLTQLREYCARGENHSSRLDAPVLVEKKERQRGNLIHNANSINSVIPEQMQTSHIETWLISCYNTQLLMLTRFERVNISLCFRTWACVGEQKSLTW